MFHLCPNLVFQTFDLVIFGTLTFPGTRWYVLTVRDPQMVRDQKKFGNHCISSYWSIQQTIQVYTYALVFTIWFSSKTSFSHNCL